MATASRCLHRLLFAAGSVPSRLRTALPVFSAAAPAAFAPTGASCLEPDSLARHHSADSNLRAPSFSIIDSGSRAIHSAPAPLHNNETLHRTSASRLGLQLLAGLEIHNIKNISSFSTKAPPPNDAKTVVIEKPKTLDDFQHEEIVGPTVERDESPVADELRDALGILQKRMVSFQKSLVVLGGLQGAGAVWCYVSWHALDPTWQLVPSALTSLLLAFVLRVALQPISFFGKLEERSRLRIITLSLMIAKGFSSFFNRARILVVASALGLLCVLLYNPLTYLLGLVGILK